MKETLLGNHNILSAIQNPLLLPYHLLPIAKTDYVKLRKIHGEVFYLRVKRSLTASKSGASFTGCLS